MYQNLTSNISQSRPHTLSIFMSFSIKSGMLNSKMKWKPEPEVVFRAILAKNQISGFSRPRISAIRLCSAATRSADRSVDLRCFGPPSWTGNRTATPRRSDSDHAECFKKGWEWFREKKCMDFEMEGASQIKNLTEDCQIGQMCKEYAMDRREWRKLEMLYNSHRDRLWVSECFFLVLAYGC